MSNCLREIENNMKTEIVKLSAATKDGVYLYSSGMYSADNYIMLWKTRKELEDYLTSYHSSDKHLYKIKTMKVEKVL